MIKYPSPLNQVKAGISTWYPTASIDLNHPHLYPEAKPFVRVRWPRPSWRI